MRYRVKINLSLTAPDSGVSVQPENTGWEESTDIRKNQFPNTLAAMTF